MNVKETLEQAEQRGREIYGVEAWEKAKNTGKALDGATVAPEMVGIGDNDRWGFISQELAKAYQNPLDVYTDGQIEQASQTLGQQAKEIADKFNNWVKELEESKLYTENAKISLYNSKRREVEAEITQLGNEQYKNTFEIAKHRYEAMEKAYNGLKEAMKPAGLSASEVSYIQAILSQDNSQNQRQKIANDFNYHLAVLDLVNSYRDKNDVNSHIIKHPLENALRLKPSFSKGATIRINGLGYYTHDILRNLYNKAVLVSDEMAGKGNIF